MDTKQNSIASLEAKPKKDCPNCQRFVDIVNAIIDDEATEEEENFFRDHMNDCTGCLNHYNIEKEIIDQVKEKLKKRCCPSSLKNSILNLIKKAK